MPLPQKLSNFKNFGEETDIYQPREVAFIICMERVEIICSQGSQDIIYQANYTMWYISNLKSHMKILSKLSDLFVQYIFLPSSELVRDWHALMYMFCSFPFFSKKLVL